MRDPMRLMVCLGAMGLLACASGSNGNEPQTAVRRVGEQPTGNGVSMAGGGKREGYSASAAPIYTAPDRAVVTTVATPVDRAFTNFLSGYLEIGIPILMSDPKAHVAGNKNVVVTSTLKGQRLSKYFNCGNGATGFPRADSYRITFSILTSLFPKDSATTEARTFVSGQGVDPGTGATAYCSSTGALERALLRAAGYTGD